MPITRSLKPKTQVKSSFQTLATTFATPLSHKKRSSVKEKIRRYYNMQARLGRAGHFFSGYYTLLLISLFLLFILRPYDRGAAYLATWKGCLTLVFFLAIFNCKHHRIIRIASIILAIPTFLFIWVQFHDNNHLVLIINIILTILFICCVTASIIYDVIFSARVTLEKIRGVICAYFMVAFAFAYMYYLTEYFLPGTIYFANRTVSISSFNHYLSEMLYFSFTTLLTIGYGDITAVRNTGQTIAVIEGITGQFYIAILVARLVSAYSFYSDKRLIKTIEKDLEKYQ